MPSHSCPICDEIAGRRMAPGGPIYDDGHWLVSHHLGGYTDPGELIVKLRRHAESLAELTPAESAALGPVLRATARGGTLVQVGNLPGNAISAVLGDLVTREITWVGSYRFVDEIDDALRAMADGLDVSPVITHRFDMDRAAEALAVATDRGSGSSKVLLRLSG
jgi:threonine dehydrogenase-like Zn-dependent dehydrogenase